MKKFVVILSVLILCTSLLEGCSTTGSPEAPANSKSEASAISEETSVSENTPSGAPSEEQKDPDATGSRTITDLVGDSVTLPPAAEIEKVIIIAPPYVSYFLAEVQKPEMIVGCHPATFKMANPGLLDILMPDREKVNTTFLDGFKSNTEEVLKMDPDVIIVYGDFQKKGLEKVDAPILNLKPNKISSVETSFKSIFKIFDAIFETNNSDRFNSEWDKAIKIKNNTLKEYQTNQPQKGLVIKGNSSDKLTVRGIGSFGDDWLKTTGLENVVDQDGDGLEVSMETIYSWNPDIIYTMGAIGAEKMLTNEIESQDWSLTKAFKDGRIYDIPKSLTLWHASSPDAPLTMQWMLSKNFPNSMTEDDFIVTMQKYYKDNYNIDLTVDMAKSILYPEKK